MAVLAIVDDLFFRAKIEAAAAAAGVPVAVATGWSATLAQSADVTWALVIIDLDLSTGDPIDLIKTVRQGAATTSILGYCAHVQADLQTRATAAGCAMVLPRSVFVKRLPDLLTHPGTIPATH